MLKARFAQFDHDIQGEIGRCCDAVLRSLSHDIAVQIVDLGEFAARQILSGR